jgi:hypothetical protein
VDKKISRNDKLKIYKFNYVLFLLAVGFKPLLGICPGYSLQVLSASGGCGLSASIPPLFGRKSLFIFYQSGDCAIDYAILKY